MILTCIAERREDASPAEFNPAHSRQPDVHLQAHVVGRKLAGQQFFCAIKDQYVESTRITVAFGLSTISYTGSARERS